MLLYYMEYGCYFRRQFSQNLISLQVDFIHLVNTQPYSFEFSIFWYQYLLQLTS